MKTRYFIFLLLIGLGTTILLGYRTYETYNKVQNQNNELVSIPESKPAKPKIELTNQVKNEIKQGNKFNEKIIKEAIKAGNKDSSHLNAKKILELHVTEPVALAIPAIFSAGSNEDGTLPKSKVEIKDTKSNYQNGVVNILTTVEVTTNNIPLTKYVQTTYDPSSNQVINLNIFEVSPIKGGKQ